MIGWIVLSVFGSLGLIVIILLLSSIKADIEYDNGFKIKAKYLFITLYPKPVSRNKKIKKKKTAKQTNKSKPEKQSLISKITEDSGLDTIASDVKKASESKSGKGFDFEMVKLLFDSAKSPVKKLIGKVRIQGLKVNVVVGGEDAAKVAITYGLQSAAISSFLGWLKALTKLEIDEINVNADFMSEESARYFKCKAKVRLSAIAGSLLHYIIHIAKKRRGE